MIGVSAGTLDPDKVPERLRIVLLGDGLWAARALHHLVGSHQVLAVVPRVLGTDGSLPEAALELGLPVRILRDVNAPDALRWIRSLDADILLSVSYDQIFRGALLKPDQPPILNLHAGDPARHRGRAILCWQLLEGAREVSLSVMRVAKGIDAGPVLALRQVALPEDATYSQALEALSRQVHVLLDEAFVALRGGKVIASDATVPTTYYPRRVEGDEWIDWSATALQVQRKIRALAPPNCLARTRMGERELLVGGAGSSEERPGSVGAPGSVVGKDKDRGLLVRCGDGQLWISTLQWADGSGASLAEFRLSDRLGADVLTETEHLRRRVAALEARLALLESAGPGLLQGVGHAV